MRITLLTSSFENVATYFRAFYLGKYLAARGHKVCVFAQGNSCKVESKVVDNVYVYLLPSFSNKRVHNLVTTIISMPFHVGFNTLSSIISNTDILHVFDVVAPQNAASVILTKIMAKKTYPLVFIDWDEWWGRGGILDVFYKDLSSMIVWFLTFLEEKIPLYGDGVTVLNEALRKRAISVGVKPEKVFILPNGISIESVNYVNTQIARKLVNLPKKAIIYTCSKSSFAPIKPYDDPLWDLLLAHKTVIKTFPNAFLCFLGRGSKECVAIAKRFNLGENVLYIDYQPIHKYSLYLAASDFLLIPLKSYNRMFDASRFPLRLLDYMALGKPIIATDLPEIRRRVKCYGLLAKPNDPEDLTKKILEMIENLDFWTKKAKEARENVVRRYSWQSIASQLEKYYYSCMNESF